MIRRELLRTIVGTIELCEIPTLVVIGRTEHPVLTTILEVGITRIDTAFPVTHHRHVVITELTSPEQLERHFRSTARIAHITGLSRPIAALIEVKTCGRVDSSLIQDLSVFRQHVGILNGVQVTDTATALIELVVPRDCTPCNKTLRDEIKILLKGKVREHTCNRTQLIARCGHAPRRVLDVRDQRVVTPRSVRELYGEEVRCHTIGTGPFLLLEELAVIAIIVARRLLLGIRTSQVYLELSGLCDLEVQIRSYIKTIIGITSLITLVVIPNLCHIALVLEVESHEILHVLRTTRNIQVCII